MVIISQNVFAVQRYNKNCIYANLKGFFLKNLQRRVLFPSPLWGNKTKYLGKIWWFLDVYKLAVNRCICGYYGGVISSMV
jgi:hypothetical protein